MNLLDSALQYAARGHHVIPLHTPIFKPDPDGVQRLAGCSCGKAGCGPNTGKHPRVRQTAGRWGSSDAEQIRKWWARWPHANIGLATGHGLIVIDIDGEADATALAAIMQDQGEQLPAPATVATGRGAHLYYEGELAGSRMVPMLIRGQGAFVVAPPSIHRSGTQYQWIGGQNLNPLPKWFVDYVETFENAGVMGTREERERTLSLFGNKPDFLEQSQRASAFTSQIDKAFQIEWTQEEESLVRSALAVIPASIQRLPWLRVGMSLHSLSHWERSDGTKWARKMFHTWSALDPEKYTEHLTDVAWNSFGRRPKARAVGIGTLFHMAKAYGWRMPVNPEEPPRGKLTHPEPDRSAMAAVFGASTPGAEPGKTNGHHSAAAVLPAFAGTGAAWSGPQAIAFIDVDEDGKPKATCTNAGQAIGGLGITCAKDVFHEKMIVGGHLINQWAGDLSDDAVQMLRRFIKRTYRFDPGERNTRDAAVQLCLEHQFNPVTDYLDGLEWDGVKRIGHWVVDYLGSPDTPLNHEIGRLMLIAAVRRARRPGSKFDQIIVWEGPEGTGKSQTLEILAGGPDNFSDQTILGRQDREQQEAVAGVWIYEIAELKDMKRADVEHVKAFASRTMDRARPAYGRFRTDAPRKCIFVATTNADTYLMSETGNRRFWPLATGKLDVEGVRRDRDQLWAEAALNEAAGVSTVLDWRLWVDAAEAQASRLESDPWEDIVLGYAAKRGHNVTIGDVLLEALLLEVGTLNRAHQMRAAGILKKCGYIRTLTFNSGIREWRYIRTEVGT